MQQAPPKLCLRALQKHLHNTLHPSTQSHTTHTAIRTTPQHHTPFKLYHLLPRPSSARDLNNEPLPASTQRSHAFACQRLSSISLTRADPSIPLRRPDTPSPTSPVSPILPSSNHTSHLSAAPSRFPSPSPSALVNQLEPKFCAYFIPRCLFTSKYPCLECCGKPEWEGLRRAWMEDYRLGHPLGRMKDVEILSGAWMLRKRGEE